MPVKKKTKNSPFKERTYQYEQLPTYSVVSFNQASGFARKGHVIIDLMFERPTLPVRATVTKDDVHEVTTSDLSRQLVATLSMDTSAAESLYRALHTLLSKDKKSG